MADDDRRQAASQERMLSKCRLAGLPPERSNLSRKTKGSNRRNRARVKVARLHARIAEGGCSATCCSL